MIPWVHLDSATVPDGGGELKLMQRGHEFSIMSGAIELMNYLPTGRHFHVYLQPDRESDEGAINVHGITDAFLVGKPRFAEVAQAQPDLTFHLPDEVGFEAGAAFTFNYATVYFALLERGHLAEGETVLVHGASGGIGHNFELMRTYWPTERLGPFPKHMIAGVPAHVDGRMLGIADALLKVLLQGTRYAAKDALELGLVDEVVGSVEELVPAAKAWIKANPAVLDQWLEGVKTLDGQEALPAVKAKL